MVRIEKEEEGLFQRRQGGVLRERAAGTDGRTTIEDKKREETWERESVCVCVCVPNNRNDKNIFIILTGLLCANIQSMTDYEVSSSFSSSHCVIVIMIKLIPFLLLVAFLPPFETTAVVVVNPRNINQWAHAMCQKKWISYSSFSFSFLYFVVVETIDHAMRIRRFRYVSSAGWNWINQNFIIFSIRWKSVRMGTRQTIIDRRYYPALLTVVQCTCTVMEQLHHRWEAPAHNTISMNDSTMYSKLGFAKGGSADKTGQDRTRQGSWQLSWLVPEHIHLSRASHT